MSFNPHLSHDVLKNLDRILFVSHIALGDFTYLQQFFKKFHQEYPNLKIDILVDDVRRTRFFWKWDSLKSYLLYDWLEASSFINRVYKETYSPGVLKKTLRCVRDEDYSIVISLCTVRPKGHSKWMRYICPRGYVLGIDDGQENKYLDISIPRTVPRIAGSEWHVTELYALWFKLLFGLELTSEEKYPVIELPKEWEFYGQDFIDIKDDEIVIFINTFAKTKKRCWPLSKLVELIYIITNEYKNNKLKFILNAPPGEYENVQKVLGDLGNSVKLLEAGDNFFQLPSVIRQCLLVVSVETSIIHIAAALKVPVIALMRKKNPEWIPLGRGFRSTVFARDRRSWVKSIPTIEVAARVKEFCKVNMSL